MTLRRLSLNPFALSAALEGLDVKEKGGAGPFFSFERVYVNLEAISLLKGGLVIRAITLTKPSLALVRNEDGTYNCQDILDEAARPKKNETPVRFSVNNIRVEGGSVDFDDRPEQHEAHGPRRRDRHPVPVEHPLAGEITTQPVFEAKVNGAPFALRGQTKPFSQTRETTVNLDFADVDLAYYLAYVPPSLPRVKSRPAVSTKLLDHVHAAGEGGSAPSWSRAPRRSASSPWSSEASRSRPARGSKAVLGSFAVFRRKARLASLKAVKPELWVRRGKTGSRPSHRSFRRPLERREAGGKAGAEPAKKPEAPRGPFLVEVAAMGIEKGRIHYDDLAFSRPFHAVLEDVTVSVKGFSTAPGRAAALELLAKSDAGETLRKHRDGHDGAVRPRGRVRGRQCPVEALPAVLR